MSMTLEEADIFLGQREERTGPMTISVHKYIQLTSELLDAAGFDMNKTPTVAKVIINPWELEVILPANKGDEGAYQCDEDPNCWVTSVIVGMDSGGVIP